MASQIIDRSSTCWRDDQYLCQNGLTPDNALAYFRLSPFWDVQCNNEVARRRGLNESVLMELAPGIEFSLQDAQSPHLFIIKKAERKQVSTNVAFYYILEGTVYQGPAMYGALHSRLERCVCDVQNALQGLHTDLDSSRNESSQDEGHGSCAALNTELLRQAMPQTSSQNASSAESTSHHRNVDRILGKHVMPVASASASMTAS